MWKRLNNQRGARQPAVGNPVLQETALDESAYARGLGIDVSRAQSPPEGDRAPPRPPRNDMPKGLPRLPFDPAPPPVPEHRDSRFRPPSPIYSQSSPNPMTTQFHDNSYPRTTPYDDDVSPPSSPDTSNLMKSNQGQTDDHEVSPVDETPELSRVEVTSRQGARPDLKPPSSGIPVLRREKRRNQVAAANLVERKEVGGTSTGRRTADVRWDPYSGEQTNSEKGKPQSVKPGQFTPPGLVGIHRSTGMSLGNESSISAAPKNQKSFGERVRNLKINAPTARPEWKGASGRATMVSPVADQMDIPPFNIPRKSSKRVASPHSGSPSPVSVIRSGGGETSPASAQMSEHIDPTIRTVLSNSGHNSPRILNSPKAAPSNFVLTATTQAAQNAQPAGYQKQDSAGNIERNFSEAFKDDSLAGQHSEEPYVQPPSRFSMSTYAPSEAQSTPRPSTDTFDRPPMPTPPQTHTMDQQPTPILNRKGPKVIEGHKVTARKAVAPSSPVFIGMTSSPGSKRASNVAKTLPQSPAEAQSIDLISSLQAQLEDLAHRKNNISKSIRQMTELMPTDSVLITDEVRRKREMEKMKVEGLREEEADVRRQEHEIGLRLHRAWKRKDKDATYELTGLWVRRVTG